MTTTIPGLGGVPVAPPPSNKRDRRKWLMARKAGLGASECAAILGLAPTGWKVTPLGIWLDKTDPDIDDGEPTERMLWGLRLERPVIDEFRVRHSADYGIRVASSPGLLRHEQFPWMLATPDRIGVDKTSGKAVSVIEAKTADHLKRDEWEDGVPLHYQIQVQCQLAVTGLDLAIVVPLFGGNHMPKPYEVRRDDLVIGQIIEICGQWWQAHVVEGMMPPPEVDDLPVLPKVWPGDDGVLTADDELESLARERYSRWKCKTEDENRCAALDVQIKEAMGDSKFLVSQEGATLATWSRFPQRRLDKDALLRDHPDLVELFAEYTTPRPSGRFTVKEPDAQ